MEYTILIKKFGTHFVALCLDLNVSAQGDTLAEARKEIESAIKLQEDYTQAEQVSPAVLDVATVKEFLFDDDSAAHIALDTSMQFIETFATKVPSYARASSV